MSADNLHKVWPDWQIESLLGRGSYGAVYKAVRRTYNIESYSAIKVISIPTSEAELDSLLAEGLDSNSAKTYLQNVASDFIKEIDLMASMKGVQNIVSVEDYAVIEKESSLGWDIFIRMELLTPFNTYARDKQLSEAEIVKLGCHICEALELCSKRNIIHRDIKPENIFINDFGHFKLGDFGIARKMESLSSGMSQKGTYNYMAPEVAHSSTYDARADLYSLGLVLYRLLNNNHLPFLDSDALLLSPNERQKALDRRLQGEALPPPCNASPALAEVILRACAFDANARFATATELKNALHNALTEQSLNKTVAVRHAPAAPPAEPAPGPATFDSPPKNAFLPLKIAAITLASALLLALLIFLLALFCYRPSSPVNEPISPIASSSSAASSSSKSEEPPDPDPDPTPAPTPSYEPDPDPSSAVLDGAVSSFLNAYVQDINSGVYSSLYSVVESGSELERDQKKYIANSNMTQELLNINVVSREKVSSTVWHVTTIEDYNIRNHTSGAYYYFQQKCVYKVRQQADGSWKPCGYAGKVERLNKVVYVKGNS